MVITVTGGTMCEKEKMAYVDYLRKKYPGREFTKIDFKLDGEYVDISYEFENKPFERIRRITGYLVGTMDRWNPGKFAEEHDRVKHGTKEFEDGHQYTT